MVERVVISHLHWQQKEAIATPLRCPRRLSICTSAAVNSSLSRHHKNPTPLHCGSKAVHSVHTLSKNPNHHPSLKDSNTPSLQWWIPGGRTRPSRATQTARGTRSLGGKRAMATGRRTHRATATTLATTRARTATTTTPTRTTPTLTMSPGPRRWTQTRS